MAMNLKLPILCFCMIYFRILQSSFYKINKNNANVSYHVQNRFDSLLCNFNCQSHISPNCDTRRLLSASKLFRIARTLRLIMFYVVLPYHPKLVPFCSTIFIYYKRRLTSSIPFVTKCLNSIISRDWIGLFRFLFHIDFHYYFQINDLIIIIIDIFVE